MTVAQNWLGRSSSLMALICVVVGTTLIANVSSAPGRPKFVVAHDPSHRPSPYADHYEGVINTQPEEPSIKVSESYFFKRWPFFGTHVCKMVEFIQHALHLS